MRNPCKCDILEVESRNNWKVGGVMSNDAWKAENTAIYRIRVTKSSGIIDAMNVALDDTGKTQAEYLRQALIEKLEREGYFPAKSDAE